MRFTWMVAVLLAVASGCDKGNRCDEVITKALDRALAGDVPPSANDTAEVAKAIEIRRCTEDKWSADVLDCYAKATALDGLHECRGKLLVEQARRLDAQERVRLDRAMRPPPSGESPLGKSKEFADRMCMCAERKDQACAKTVQDDMLKWSTDNAERLKDFKLTDDEEKDAKALGEKMSSCMMRLMSDASDDSNKLQAIAEDDAHKAQQAAKDAQDAVDKAAKELDAINTEVANAVDAVVAAQTDEDRASAKARLTHLQQDQAATRARVDAARAAAERAVRMQGVKISPECLQNPLAKGCN